MKLTIKNEDGLSKWRLLFKISGILAIIMAIIIPIQVIIFSISFPPETVEGWFQLFHDNWLLGLIEMDLFFAIDNIIIIIMYLSFYFTLRRTNQSMMIIAIVLGLIGIAAYFSSNTAFEMLSVSNQYYSASASQDKTVYLAVGQMLVESWTGTAFLVYYILNGITLLIISTVMYKSELYTKRMATFGLIAGILMTVPSNAGIVGMIFSLLSLIPWVVFSIMAASRFLKFSEIRPIGDLD
ncbi:MAG: hypothetical protein H6Q59_1063 [Firmicutes bacterium]|nr:hypothetical protein [Bacillota bacterium]